MDDIMSPALLIDEDKCRRNIRHMIAKARHSDVIFRPHFKTHQSQIIGRWFREAGTEKICVSSLSMANYFAADGWQDIMVAFPVNIREIQQINELAARIQLSILIADSSVLPFLNEHLQHPTQFYIKIDVGNYRSGFHPDETDDITRTLKEASENRFLQFKGFVAHAGQTYQTHSLNDVQKAYSKGTRQLISLRDMFREEYPGIIASWGDTPTCSLVNEFEGIDEIRPGNFVFYDLMQFHLASCDWEQIAVAVAAPVVAKRKMRNEIILYAGAIHLSKDAVEISDLGHMHGEIVKITKKGWERFPQPMYINRVSQEHGIFHCPDECWNEFQTGDLVGIIPAHSCLTANLLRERFYNLKRETFFPEPR
ncbi:MAG: alanine racemase [bacterium]